MERPLYQMNGLEKIVFKNFNLDFSLRMSKQKHQENERWEKEEPLLLAARRKRRSYEVPYADEDSTKILKEGLERYPLPEAPTMPCIQKSRETLRKISSSKFKQKGAGSHQDHIADERYASMFHNGMVRKLVSMKDAVKIPEASSR